jgi:glycerol-3-phosphate acyltransferase PlsY
MTVVVVAMAYLLGTIPTALLVGRRAGFDPTAAGSGNPGASNAYRLGGRTAGAIVLVADASKGAAAAAIGMVAGGPPLALLAGSAAVLGHVAPFTRPGRGGKGVATGFGVILVLEPVVGCVAAGIWVLCALLTRTASIASVVAVLVAVALTAVSGRPAWEVLGMLLVAVLVVARHRGNLARVVAGGEAVLPIRSDATPSNDS